MKYALIGNTKTEATKGAKGICPVCGSELIAKCGTNRMSHWAHKGIRNCDSWWEKETEWHRNWKDNFPQEWQEVVLKDENTREKHIADLRTKDQLTIEFQHSFLDSSERVKREQFYQKMLWIVDGTRLQRDWNRFKAKIPELRKTITKGAYIVEFPDEYFPKNWLKSSVPVIFDFQGLETFPVNDLRNHLYLLYPNKGELDSKLVVLLREQFITDISEGNFNDLFETQNRQEIKPVINSNMLQQRPPSKFVLHKGSFVRKKRF